MPELIANLTNHKYSNSTWRDLIWRLPLVLVAFKWASTASCSASCTSCSSLWAACGSTTRTFSPTRIMYAAWPWTMECTVLARIVWCFLNWMPSSSQQQNYSFELLSICRTNPSGIVWGIWASGEKSTSTATRAAGSYLYARSSNELLKNV